jgi:hypothetical protein
MLAAAAYNRCEGAGRKRRLHILGPETAMFAVLSLFLVLVLSITVVRIATIALTLTGVSRELARFQARSAFTGVGFTTSESEVIVGHPVRRRIIMTLMLLGNAGIVTVISSLMLSFVTVGRAAGITESLWFRVTMVAVGGAILLYLSHSQWVDRLISRLVALALRRFTRLEIRDYAGLLHLTGGYIVSELFIKEGDWLAERSLQDLKLTDEGVLILGVVKPDGTFFGAPRGYTRLKPGDTAILYGRRNVVANLDQRRWGAAGDQDHAKVVGEQEQIEAREYETHQDMEADEEGKEAEAEAESEASKDETEHPAGK